MQLLRQDKKAHNQSQMMTFYSALHGTPPYGISVDTNLQSKSPLKVCSSVLQFVAVCSRQVHMHMLCTLECCVICCDTVV